MEAQVNNMEIKQQIKELKVGESLSLPYNSTAEKQRVRNYCHDLEGEFKTRSTSETIKVTRLSFTNRESLSNDLRAMQSGDVIYPTRSSSLSVVQGVAAMLGGGYKISKVIKVEKI